jgi:hypothetical protein
VRGSDRPRLDPSGPPSSTRPAGRALRVALPAGLGLLGALGLAVRPLALGPVGPVVVLIGSLGVVVLGLGLVLPLFVPAGLCILAAETGLTDALGHRHDPAAPLWSALVVTSALLVQWARSNLTTDPPESSLGDQGLLEGSVTALATVVGASLIAATATALAVSAPTAPVAGPVLGALVVLAAGLLLAVLVRRALSGPGRRSRS